MDKVIKFGTDGWRAVIAEDFTFDNVRACAQGLANYLKQAKLAERGLVIGYDTRFASEDFAAAAAEVIAGNKIKVTLCSKVAPTPVISYAVTATKSAGAIIITASHNPGRWNGFKLKDEAGASAPSEVAAEVEKNANEALSTGEVKRLPLADGLNNGLITYFDPDPVYFKQLERLIDLETIRHSNLKVIVDSMYGAGIGYFKGLLKGGKIEVLEINNERNPSFPGIQPEPIAKNLTKLSNTVTEYKANVGIANDGDADRIGIIDEKGNFLNQHQVFALLALYFLEVRGERGAIVETLTDSTMLHILGKQFDVPVYETPVGFKYVAPMMIEKNALIGGEESGGYGFRGHVPERDGILAGLYFLDSMIKTGKTPSQLLDYLFSKVGPHYYDRLDFHVSPGDRQKLAQKLIQPTIDSIAGTKVAKLDTTDGYKYYLADDSWLLIRFSGTEPLIRIYAEGHSPEQVQKLLEGGRKLLGL
ncbi:MAG: phosphoglucomutase/phosphomannomutase family protein [Chloroflexi bacterium]|nr:phosphoglucomutase/phosphomannomutase family protein [Chloroflexota bacterium]MBL7062088.1 phosphoglucomutase/phosphomannomutase family protein [Dehalococcoidia bacterium]